MYDVIVYVPVNVDPHALYRRALSPFVDVISPGSSGIPCFPGLVLELAMQTPFADGPGGSPQFDVLWSMDVMSPTLEDVPAWAMDTDVDMSQQQTPPRFSDDPPASVLPFQDEDRPDSPVELSATGVVADVPPVPRPSLQLPSRRRLSKKTAPSAAYIMHPVVAHVLARSRLAMRCKWVFRRMCRSGGK